MKVVLDTNVWLSGVFWQGEAYKLINTLQKNKIEIVVAKEILLEIIKVLNREARFQRFMQNRMVSVEELLKTIVYIGRLITPKIKLDIIKEDPPDNRILEVGVSAKADYIISYDNHLLKLKEYSGVRIVKPKEFLKVLTD